jgi:LuxR family maltose regulon positive regulatory protein
VTIRGTATVSELRAVRPGAPVPAVPPFPVVESKLVAPLLRRGLVDRQRLVERLLESQDCSVIAVVAPAGYGKSTLLAQWAARTRPRVGWLSIDEQDNDPTVLLGYLAIVLDRIEHIDPAIYGRLASPGAGITDVARLHASIGAMSEPVTLVLDHVELLTSRAARDVVAELTVRLPYGSQVAIGSRHAVPVPVARLRAERALLEIGADDLGMDRTEAGELLAGAGAVIDDETIDELHRRTEGWPAGLYLAALAMNAGSSSAHPPVAFTGDDRFVGDYLRSELLANVSRADATFLTRTSVLESLSGPLCDAIVGRQGSDRVLDRLEQQNLLVVPLDRRRERFRYHHLFRELLQSELHRREPGTVAELHARAAAWYEQHDQPEAAIEHAQQANDADRVARLVLRVANPAWASGRVDTVLRWMEWFSNNGLVEQHPAIALHGSLIHALVGDAGGAERWVGAAERAPVQGVLEDGNTMEGSLAYLRALLCRDGLDEMRRDAAIALCGLSPSSPYRAAMLHAEGVSYLLDGDLEAADVVFARALDESTSSGLVPFIPVVLAERGIVAIARDDWAEADALAAQAVQLMGDGRFDEYWSSALVYGWAARTACRRGAIAEARDLTTRAARLRPLLTYVLPIVSAQALLELARAYVALGDQNGGRAVLRQLAAVLQQRPKLGTVAQQAHELRSRLDVLKVEALGASALTTAELRLIPLLPTHLSFAEIAERLFVSRNTVKTQAISIYRKLGVSSRSETIARMSELGLVAMS